jgi:hypothetical protein
VGGTIVAGATVCAAIVGEAVSGRAGGLGGTSRETTAVSVEAGRDAG